MSALRRILDAHEAECDDALRRNPPSSPLNAAVSLNRALATTARRELDALESALRFCRDCLDEDEHEAREIIDAALGGKP